MLASSDLLHTVIAFLAEGAPPAEARAALNTLALVSRRFRALSGWDEWWRAVAVGLLPVLGAHSIAAGVGGKGKGGKGNGGKGGKKGGKVAPQPGEKEEKGKKAAGPLVVRLFGLVCLTDWLTDL